MRDRQADTRTENAIAEKVRCEIEILMRGLVSQHLPEHVEPLCEIKLGGSQSSNLAGESSDTDLWLYGSETLLTHGWFLCECLAAEPVARSHSRKNDISSEFANLTVKWHDARHKINVSLCADMQIVYMSADIRSKCSQVAVQCQISTTSGNG